MGKLQLLRIAGLVDKFLGSFTSWFLFEIDTGDVGAAFGIEFRSPIKVTNTLQSVSVVLSGNGRSLPKNSD